LPYPPLWAAAEDDRMPSDVNDKPRQTANVRPRWAWLLWAQLAIILLATLAAYLDRLNLSLLALPGVDKLLHFVLFGALAFFSVGWWVDRSPWAVLGSLSGLAILEEISQSLSVARTFSLVDLTATLLGVLVFGVVASRSVHRCDRAGARQRKSVN
jgi:VanZ family protein